MVRDGRPVFLRFSEKTRPLGSKVLRDTLEDVIRVIASPLPDDKRPIYIITSSHFHQAKALLEEQGIEFEALDRMPQGNNTSEGQ